MNPSRPTRSRPDRGHRRALAGGLLVSVLLHLAVALLWRGPVLERPAGAPGAASPPDDRPVAEGGLRAVSLDAPEEVRIPRRPEPLEAAEAPDVRRPRTTGSDLTTGELERPRAGSGAGDGAGGEGAGTVRPPVPRSVMPEWDAPPSVRGRTVRVRVHVDSAGEPTGPVELLSRTPDEAFNRRLVRKVRAMRFSPALDPRGRPVAAWAELRFTF